MINSSSSYRIYHMRIKSNRTAQGTIRSVSALKAFFLKANIYNWLQYAIHAAAWLVLYFLPSVLSNTLHISSLFVFADPGNWVYLLSFTLLVVFTYLNHYWFVPFFFMGEFFFTYFLLAFIFLLTINGIQILASAKTTYSYLQAGLNYTLLLFIIISLSSIIIHLGKTVATGKKEISRMKLLYLNSQVKPHFLFQSLNWIYSLSLKESKETPDAILQLSALMKHILKESTADFTELSKELDYVRNYVSLQSGRLGDAVAISCSIPLYKGRAKIAPLLMMTFIENAFRHGVSLHNDSAISIDISVTENLFCLHVINNRTTLTLKGDGGGIGIKNAQERLQLLYPYTHQLEIIEEAKIYSVKLLINLL